MNKIFDLEYPKAQINMLPSHTSGHTVKLALPKIEKNLPCDINSDNNSFS